MKTNQTDSTAKSNPILRIVLATSVVIPLVLSLVFKGNLVVGPFNLNALIPAVVSSILVFVIGSFIQKRVMEKNVQKFAQDIQVIKQGDYSKLIIAKDYESIGELAPMLNGVLSDIRNLIENFFSLVNSINNAS